MPSRRGSHLTNLTRWANDPTRECGSDDATALTFHRCVKDREHVSDPTNDDHQCCCGHMWDEVEADA